MLRLVVEALRKDGYDVTGSSRTAGASSWRSVTS
jgi:hypothetical protein